MSENASGLDWFFEEVQRRGLIHAAGVYAVACWFLVQLLATVLPHFGIGDMVVRVAIAVTFAGLPLVVGAAWLVGGGTAADVPVSHPDPPEEAGPARRRARPAHFSATEAVVLVLVAFAGGALWAYRHFDVAELREATPLAGVPEIPPEVTRRSVAVLPFDNVGPDPGRDFFSEGVAEEIRSALSRVPGLRVASRTSSFHYAETNAGTRRIGAELMVGSVLEGSVQRAGERLRVRVRLVDTRDDRQIWSETYDRRLDMESLFAVEEEIARSVARALEVELAEGTPERLAGRGTVSLEAHDLYLLGLYHWNRRTGGEIRQAVELFRAAAEREPDYALAYAGLANAYVLLPLYAGVSPDEAMPEARRAAERALSLDGTLAEAHAALAFVRMSYDRDWEEAEAGFRRAISLHPSYATALEWYAVLLDARGRHEEARSRLEEALALDPMSLIINAVFGRHLTFVGEYERAIEQHRRTLEIQSEFPLGLQFLAEAYLLAGRFPEAVETLRRWAEVTGTPAEPWGAVVRGMADPTAGAEAARALDRLAEAGGLSAYDLGRYYALMGAKERALSAVERAFREKDVLMFWVDVDPAFAPLRDDPRFLRVVREMGLAGRHTRS